MFISKIFISVLVLCCIECSYGTTIETHPNVNLLPKSCGDIDNIKFPSESIVAKLYEFPWMALISYRTGFGINFKCSGTIINSKYILTAAHCVSDKQTIHVAGVRIGEFDIRNSSDCQGEEPQLVCESHLQDIQFENIIRHPNFTRKPAPANDIALIRLREPIDFNYKNAIPICLPVTQKLQNTTLAGVTGVIAGWGLEDPRINSGSLLKTPIMINTDDECSSLIFNSPAGGRDRVLREICAGENRNDSCKGDSGDPLMVQDIYEGADSDLAGVIDRIFGKNCAEENRKDGCTGDSGGPLMVQDIYEGADRYIQYGIVSRGSAKCGTEPGIYTDVTKYMEWILDNIKE